jgi:DNA repair exonuclease SbcCD ATPase subunit
MAKTATRSKAGEQQALIEQLAELEAQVREYDTRLADLSRQREGAEASLAAGVGDVVTRWRLEEQVEEASKLIVELIAEREPVADRARRLDAIVSPLRAREREVSELRAAVAGLELLAAAVAKIDESLALVEQARPHLNQSGGREREPEWFRKFAAAWGPAGWTRHRADFHLGAGLDSKRALLARLERGELLP